MTELDATLLQRWTAMGLTHPELRLAPDQTITARTFAAQAPTPAREPSVDPQQLPRISLDQRGPLPPDAVNLPRADLSLVATLGEGGMGRVHLARQHSLARDVAIKTLKQNSTADVMVALLHEARLTGSLEHPGVIPVHALGVDDEGRPVLVMKRVEGVDWHTMLTDPSHPNWALRGGTSEDRLAQNLEILAQVSQTVEFAHSRGVIHRDIKPENVMIGRFGEVLLVDWGLAVTATDPPTQMVVGTPMFMAPEMARGDAIDARTDVYLLGATLHAVLTGRGRHEGGTLLELLGSVVTSAPVVYGPLIPAALAELCNRATSRDPADRPASAQQFRHAILEFLRHRSALALSEAAAARLAAFDALLADTPAAVPPHDLAAAYRLLTEARFGYAHCLREHPDTEAAQRGLRACAVASIDLELRQQHAETARALLGELSVPDAALVARVETAEAIEAERSRASARLQAMARDLDTSVGRRSRTIVAGLMVVAVVLAGAVLGSVWGGQVRPVTAVWAHLLVTAGIGVGFALIRRSLWSSAVNRRLTLILAASLAATAANRVFGVLLADSLGDILWRDLLLMGSFLAAGAIALLPRLGWAVVPAVVGTVIVPFAGDHALSVFSVSLVSLVGVTTWAVNRTGMRS